MYYNGFECDFMRSYVGSCSATYECMPWQNLICQTTANACNCPTTSQIG
jgi:hypothetical protein